MATLSFAVTSSAEIWLNVLGTYRTYVRIVNVSVTHKKLFFVCYVHKCKCVHKYSMYCVRISIKYTYLLLTHILTWCHGIAHSRGGFAEIVLKINLFFINFISNIQ